MTLIDEGRAEHLYAAMGPATVASGGSAGNTAAGIASFGGKVAYSARCGTTSSAGFSRTTSGDRRELRDQALANPVPRRALHASS